MAPKEGRVAKPQPLWGCRRGTPGKESVTNIQHNLKGQKIQYLWIWHWISGTWI